MRHFIEDMTDQDLLSILLSPFTPADYKMAALKEQTKRANMKLEQDLKMPRGFKFGRNFDLYINRPVRKTSIEEVELPKKYGGRVLVDFDDYESDIVESYKKGENIDD